MNALDHIIAPVAAAFGMHPDCLGWRASKPDERLARAVVCTMARRHTKMTQPKIAAALGLTDPGSPKNGEEMVTVRASYDEAFARVVAEIEGQVRGAANG